MFRKPKRSNKVKAGMRKRPSVEEKYETVAPSGLGNNDDAKSDNDGNDGENVLSEIQQERKRLRTSAKADSKQEKEIMHSYSTSGPTISASEAATSTAEHHPTDKPETAPRNKLLAGPARAATNIRTTCRFDYQPDICKDYKDTGFCGFGDTCIYLHDRGDTLAGWQIEQQWQEEQDAKKKAAEAQIEEFMNRGKKGSKKDKTTDDADGLPFACILCRSPFQDPVVTNCGHYFCESCLLSHIRTATSNCPVCKVDTHSVMHQPTKLLSKKRRVCGRDSTWREFYDKFASTDEEGDGEN